MIHGRVGFRKLDVVLYTKTEVSAMLIGRGFN